MLIPSRRNPLMAVSSEDSRRRIEMRRKFQGMRREYRVLIGCWSWVRLGGACMYEALVVEKTLRSWWVRLELALRTALSPMRQMAELSAFTALMHSFLISRRNGPLHALLHVQHALQLVTSVYHLDGLSEKLLSTFMFVKDSWMRNEPVQFI